MVHADWKKILAVAPEAMTEKDKDDLCETVAWHLPDNSMDKKHLIHFLKVAQEILKFKSLQVDSLMNELDAIAAKQGEEEAKEKQGLLEEIEQLKEQLEYNERLGRDSGASKFVSGSELKSKIVQLEIQNEELMLELHEREKDLIKERSEVENLASQIASLQRENQDLRKELITVHEDERLSGRSPHDSPEFGSEKQKELMDLIRQKNKHITQLLDDIDTLEDQNSMLKSKLKNVCDELSEATSHIGEMTMHLSQMKHLNEELSKKLNDSDEKNSSFLRQIEELVEEKSKYDKQLDEIGEMYNTKVQEWKEILEAKDNQIFKAEEEIKLLSNSTHFLNNEFTDLEMKKKVAEQEEQIFTLRNELIRATEEINSCTELIESFKDRQAQLHFSDSDQLQVQIAMYEENIHQLEEKVKYAEDDALRKAEEISEMVIQLREFEMGEFGLEDAMNKIHCLEKTLETKDMQIEKLVESCNNMEIAFENIEEQNMALREKLGMPLDEEIDTTQVKLKFRKDLEVTENLKLCLNKKEEELVKAKLKYRKLLKFVRCQPDRPDFSAIVAEGEQENKFDTVTYSKYLGDKSNLEKKLSSVIKENDALRKGMHEILESIQNQDGAGKVEIQSSCLERLLEALDSRHVSGWYHPAMRLQAQLNNAEGKNEELRNQIRSLKEEEKSKSNELHEAYLKIHNLSNELFTLRSPREDVSYKSRSPESETNDIEISSQDKRSLTNLEQEQKIIDLEVELQELKVSYNKVNADLEKVENEKAIEKEELLTKIVGLEGKVSALMNNIEGKAIDSSPESQVIVLNRQVNFLRLLESEARSNNERIYKSMLDSEQKFLQEILRLQSDKTKFILIMEGLEKELLQSVPRSKFDEVTKELMEISVKYQHAVSLNVANYQDNIIERLEEEIKLLQTEKNSILDNLRIVKEKLILNDELQNDSKNLVDDKVATIVEKLAASEVRELAEKQKSSHLEKVNLMLKSELQDLETFNKEMSRCITELKEENKILQDAKKNSLCQEEAENRAVELNIFKEKIEDVEKKLKIAENDKENFRELFEISQGQCRSLENYREGEKLKISSLKEQILLLQSNADEKSIIAKISNELLTCQLSFSRMEKANNYLQDRLTKLMAKNLILQTEVQEANNQNFEIKRKHMEELDMLQRVIKNLHKIYGTGATIFPEVEVIYKMKKRLKARQDEEWQRSKELKNEMLECAVKKDEFETRLKGLEILTASINGDSKQLLEWYNKGTNLRIEIARCKRQNQFLVNEMTQLETYIKKMDEEIIALEESGLVREKQWERQLTDWSNSANQKPEVIKCENPSCGKVLTSLLDEATQTIAPDEHNDTNSDKIVKTIEDQAEIINRYETKMKICEDEIQRLKEELGKRNGSLTSPTAKQDKQLDFEVAGINHIGEETEKTALKVTVQSLQNIIKCKEDTICKYQELLKAGRDEYCKSSGRFQEELRTLHEALLKQSKAYSKLKNSLETTHQVRDSLPKTLERYLTKIQELEDDLTDCKMTLTSVNNLLFKCENEKEKWKNLAEERLAVIEQMQYRLEVEHKNELESYKTEIVNCQAEIERLRRYTDEVNNDGSGDHIVQCQNVTDIQGKIFDYGNQSLKENENDWSSEKSSKGKDSVKQIKILERQLKFAKDESTRLREQLRLAQLQKIKRSKTASSVTSRSGSESKSSLKEESLQSKVKTLEELLKIAKEREQDLVEGNQHRIKSAEEVARWGEKKKSQQTIQNLNSKLKEKEAEIELLKSKNDSFRSMIHKCERDRNMLEAQLKAAKEGPDSMSSRIQKLMDEKSKMEKEILELRNKLEMQQRHEGGIGAALLVEKLESQERKIAVLELASQGGTSVAEELQKLEIAYSNLEKCNLKLESENLALQLQLEKEKSELKRILEKNKELEKMLLVAQEISQAQKQEKDKAKAPLTLYGKLDKVSHCRNCRSNQSTKLSYIENLKRDHEKLKEDHKIMRKKYLDLLDKNNELEEELKKSRYQIHLLEEKDLADSISKTNNIQLASELSQELLQVKAQLNHKTQLLNRVKVLLTKAAAKERALNEKVNALQNMVMPVGTKA